MVNATPVLSRERIAEFCRQHHIRRLSLFGSVLRDDFTDHSDVDVLVEFEPDKTPGYEFISMEEELSEMFGRKVDMGTFCSLNRHLRDRVLASMEVLFEKG